MSEQCPRLPRAFALRERLPAPVWLDARRRWAGCARSLRNEFPARSQRPSTITCSFVNECDPTDNPIDLEQGNPRCPSYGYPSHYRCTTWLPRGRCAPPECELDPQLDGQGDPAICEALAYGNVNPM